MIKAVKLALFSLLLTACVSRVSDFNLPEQVNFDGVIYQKITDNRLDEMRQLLYLPSDSSKNPENWQQGILFFLDQNQSNKTLAERLALRQQVFKTQENIAVKLEIVQNELRSQVIYPPTERFNNIQLELSRGRNMACGFGQIQFSDKKKVGLQKLTKKEQNPTAYQQELAQLAVKFVQLPWLIECK